MNKEFLKALEVLAEEKRIDKDTILEAMEFAMQTAIKKETNRTGKIKVKIDKETGEMRAWSEMEVVDTVEDFDTQIALEELDGEHFVGEVLEEEIVMQEFGRLAAQTAKQVAIHKIRETERDSLIKEFDTLEGEIVTGVLKREDAFNYYVDLGRSYATLPKSEIIPGEKLKMESSISVYLTKVDKSDKFPVLYATRKSHHLVSKVIEREIPEIAEGIIELHSIARDAGDRTKVAVYSLDETVDAIGSCIGNKGVRIQNIINALNGEKIEIILYSKANDTFIANALSPAKVLNVIIKDPMQKSAVVIVSDDQLSLAIGKKGQNARLAAKLTGWRIDIKSLDQANSEGIF